MRDVEKYGASTSLKLSFSMPPSTTHGRKLIMDLVPEQKPVISAVIQRIHGFHEPFTIDRV